MTDITKFEDILAKVYENFSSSKYNYNYWEDDFSYHHEVNFLFITKPPKQIKVVESGVCKEEGYWMMEELDYTVFEFENKFYKITYGSGSQ